MSSTTVPWLLFFVTLSVARSTPVVYHSGDSLGAVSEVGQRLASLSLLTPEPRGQAPRLPIPSAQDLENVKKVAQILRMLGEQRNKRYRKQLENLANIIDTLNTLRPQRPTPHKTRIIQNVIPSILGDITPAHTNPPPAPSAVVEIPNDPVQAK